MPLARNAILALLLASAARPGGAMTADELVAKNVAARGGLGRLDAIRSLRLTGRAVFGLGFGEGLGCAVKIYVDGIQDLVTGKIRFCFVGRRRGSRGYIFAAAGTHFAFGFCGGRGGGG